MFGDGRQTRDFVYVADVAAAFAAASELAKGLERTIRSSNDEGRPWGAPSA